MSDHRHVSPDLPALSTLCTDIVQGVPQPHCALLHPLVSVRALITKMRHDLQHHVRQIAYADEVSVARLRTLPAATDVRCLLLAYIGHAISFGLG